MKKIYALVIVLISMTCLSLSVYAQSDLSYTSGTTTQNTASVFPGSSNAYVIGVQIVTTGTISTGYDAGSFTFSTNGTTNAGDLTAAKIYYTGTSSVFSTSTQFGSLVSNPVGIFTVTGTQELSPGTNYFWLAYDISTSAAAGNLIDAECSSITVADTIQTPTITAPAGARTVVTQVITGTGTSSDYRLPISRRNAYSGCEMIYTSAEMGGIPLMLNSIAWDKASGSNVANITLVTIYMKHTTADTLATGTYNLTGYTQVYTGNFPNGTTTGWMSVNLATAFNYNGTNNLQILVIHGSQAGVAQAQCPTYFYTTTSTNRCRYYTSATAPATASLAATTMLPNTSFGVSIPQFMTYTSSTTTQNTANIAPNSTNGQIIGLQVVMSQPLNPLITTSITFNTNGTTNAGDITNARVYYTGNSSTFATTTQFGTAVASPSGTFTVAGSATMSTGINYFWLAYDIALTAAAGNLIDAECTSITTGGIAYIPTVTAPAGARPVVYNEITGTGTGSDYQLPICRHFAYSGCEMIYTPAEMGGMPLLITSIGWNKASGSNTAGITNVTIFMKHTTSTSLTSGTYSLTGYTQVYSGSFPNTSSTGWMTVTLADTFLYDGTDNLQILVLHGSQTLLANNYPYYYYTTTTTSRCRYYASASAPSGQSFTATTELPNTKFGFLIPTNMTYSSETSSQPNTNFAGSGQNDNGILLADITTAEYLNPLTVSDFTFNTNGSTAAGTDITNAKLYYTGSSSVLSTSNLVGTFSSPNGLFTMTPSAPVTLLTGENYFWLAYDIPATAVTGDVIDAEFISATIAGTAETPVVSAPSGNRMITGPLCGTYTIDPSQPASSTNFISFSSAKSLLEAVGISCPVIFNVAPGTYNEQLAWGVTPIPNISSVNTVTFQSANNDSSGVIIQANVSTVNYVFQMNAATYLIWNKLTFQADPLSTANGCVIKFTNAANHIQFQHCRFTGISGTSTTAAYAIINDDNTTENNITFSNNRFENGSYGFYWLALSGGLETGNIISNNVFVNQYSYGIYITYQDGIQITGNSITTGQASTTFYGIYTSYNQNSSIVAGNKISIANGGDGIYRLNCTGTSSLPGLVYNNFISIGGTVATAGIYHSGSPYQRYYHNSINIYSTFATSYGLFVTGTSPLNIESKNNIFYNQGNGYAFYSGTAYNGAVSNYNDLYTAGTHFGYWGSNYASFTAWQTATSQDLNSVSIVPFFTSNTDLHTLNGVLNAHATPITLITTDIDGETRDLLTPDIGADEFVPLPHDAYLVSMLSPVSGCGNYTEPVTIKIMNTGTATINPGDVTAYYSINNATPVSETVNTTILPGQAINWSFSTQANVSAVTMDQNYNILAYVSLTGDIQNVNDTVHVNLLSVFTPFPPVVAGDTVSYGSTAIVDLQPVTNTTPFWYYQPTGSNYFSFGNTTYTTPPLYDTTCYYVELAGTILADATIGTGTGTYSDYYGPYDNYYTKTKTQFLITAAELTAAGIGAGPITGISFDVSAASTASSSTPPANCQNLSIFLTSTSLTSLSSWITSGFTQVYYNSGNFNDVTGWNTHTFNQGSFVWDGSSNIIIMTSHCNSGTYNYGTAATMLATTTSYVSCNAYYDDDTDPNCTTGELPLYTESQSLRPNIKLHATVPGCRSDRVPVCVVVTNIPANDAGCTDITSPVSGIELTNAESVTVNIYNWGTTPIYNFPISFEVAELGIQVTEILQDTVYSGAMLTHTFQTTVDLSALGTYHFMAYTSTLGDTYYANDTAYSTVINSPLVYCTPTYDYACSSDDYINNFWTTAGLMNISNLNSGCNGNADNYIYYSNMSVMVNPGNSFTIHVQSGSAYAEGFGVWIDFNNDGDFTDAGEHIWSSASANTTAFTYAITIPAGTAIGTHRMRVRCEYDVAPTDPCADLDFGETEDYNITVMPLVDYDASIVNITSPTGSAIQGSTVNVSVTLMNTGLQPLTGLSIYYTINSVPQDTMVWTGNLAFLSSTTATFPVGMVVPAGSFNICAYLIYPADQYAMNNSFCISSFGVVTFTIPYVDNFDGTNYWLAGPATSGSQWQLGTPAYGTTNSAYSAPNSWDVNLTTAYTDNANCMLYTPYFDFTGVSNTKMDFMINYNAENSYDGLRIAYTTNGTSWAVLGTYNDPLGTNWYNAASVASSGNHPVWTGNSGGWVKASHSLAQFNNMPLVRFRFIFTSDASMEYSGISIDNFSITRYDLGLTAINSPVNGCDMTLQNVTITIHNYGDTIFGGVPVSYWLAGGNTITDTITATILPNADFTYTFATQVNLTSVNPATFTLNASVNYPADLILTNNQIQATISNGITPSVNPSADNVTIWSSGTATLSVINPSPYYTYSWYDAVGGTDLHDGTSFTTPALFDTTVYYLVESSGGACPSSFVPVTIFTQYAPYDAMVWSITSPVSGLNLTSSEIVTANVYNNGLDTLYLIPVHYTVNGGTAVNDMIPGPLAPGQHIVFTFAVNADLSVPGNYHICVYTTYPNDGVTANDNLCIYVAHTTCNPSYTYNCVDGDQLTAFQLSNLSQTGIPCNGGYIDYSGATCINITQDSMYIVSGITGYSGEYVTIWVDYNNNLTFTADEIVVTNWEIASAGQSASNIFTIPEYSLDSVYTAGSHRMRVVVNWLSSPTDPCGSYSFGQTMDYCVIVAPNSAFTVNLTATNLNCWGASTGAVDLSIVNTSGVSPFTYLWSNGQTTQDLTGLAAGTYSVTVTDAATNTNTASVTVTQPGQLSTSLFGTDVTTLGGNDGTVTQLTIGGISPYTYLWAPGGQTTGDLTGLFGGLYRVTVTDAHNCTFIDSITINTPNPWSPAPTITTMTHNIHIPANALITLDGNVVPPGSWVGVFYHQGSNLVCGGAHIWNNMDIDLTAYGNTAVSGPANGFASGETFSWKVWVPSPAGDHQGTATYIQPPIYLQTSAFLLGGHSGISALAAITIQYQTINLPAGWGIWSTYIIPNDANLKHVLLSIQPVPYDNVTLANNKVVIVKDELGHVYWPQFNLCTIGEYTGSTQNNTNIILGQGYQIKTTQATSFTVAGLACVPELSPISLNSGWFIIGYLRMTPGPIVGANGTAMLSTLGAYTGSTTNCITIMKDQIGHVYWPQFNLCTIGEYTGSTQNNTNMVPGQGYQVKMLCPGTLTYLPNSSSSLAKSEVISIPQPYYYSDVEITGNNMTLGIPASSWTTKPVIGDEIGVFNPGGELSGSSVYFGGNTEITIWGDDMTTPYVEGVGEGRPFTIKIWHQETNTVEDLVVDTWVEGSGIFTTDGISIAGKSTIVAYTYALLQNNPNPFRENTTITFRVPEDTQVSISLYNVLGDKITDIVTGYYKAGEYKIPFNATGLAAGSYFYKIITSGFVATRQMNISK
ncbi:MAG: GEVED domain-containing protein [Bacteroidia bacterium]|nr:GEVED domain-containing protein [Bacteroidia bacterium]